ncbi:prepilin-type N-terminal cleavage/methylation domain-containing protein [Thermosulfurimonas sp. F29]|uniref:type IV pilus modification PilV family protein n=1 Tax=Thermosulfurimonas sp. F29 TaxID=2867247 RepID=UPI001C829A39|nr:prepilin-type N-terminal cleavage/methylation domain-containing protein [Thermosulfurimonas sp. F29]MBX6423040.1 prepilin-type N-terminal cleavage/methylation domain-containing protein [Thermosulfurimonas sp. F29]
MQRRKLSLKGYSLVEVMVSLMILLIIAVGILEAMRIFVSRELESVFRREAARLAAACLEELRLGAPCFGFTDCGGGTCTGNYTYRIKNLSKDFLLTFTDPSLIGNGTEVFVRVEYSFRGVQKEMEMRTWITPYETKE